LLLHFLDCFIYCPFSGQMTSVPSLCTCSCRRLAPLDDLFFCSACSTLKCPDAACTAESVDFLYCPQCFATTLPLEAARTGHQCSRCFACPVCTSPTRLRDPPPSVGAHIGGKHRGPPLSSLFGGVALVCTLDSCAWTSDSLPTERRRRRLRRSFETGRCTMVVAASSLCWTLRHTVERRSKRLHLGRLDHHRFVGCEESIKGKLYQVMT
jgi:hypothetical protein